MEQIQEPIKPVNIGNTIKKEVFDGENNVEFKSKKKEKVLHYLEKSGILISRNPDVFDFEKMGNVKASNFNKLSYPHNGSQKGLNYSDFIEALNNEKCFSKDDIETDEYKKGILTPRNFFKAPGNKKDLIEGVKEGEGIINPWDFGRQMSWGEKIILEDGTISNILEIFIAKKLKELGAHRENGVLKIIDPKNGDILNFNGKNFEKLIGKEFIITLKINDNTERFNFGSRVVSDNYLKNLMEAGILRNEDFKILGGTVSNEIYGATKKKLNPKAPYVSFTNKYGYARYYLGREKIVGTKTTINENMYVIQLDNNLVGIMENLPGKKSRLLYTFDGLNEQDMKSKIQKITEKIQESNKDLSNLIIANNLIVDGGEMKNRIKEYKITRLFPKQHNELPEEYAERIARLGDVDYVINNFRNFFSKVNIGVHNLSWEDQLIIANAILEQKDDKTLINFASKHKLNGLRTFLSVEHGGREMGDKIILLGEKLPEDIARKIFNKYGEIIDAVDKAEEDIRNLYEKNNIPNEVIFSIKEKLLKKGANMLSGLSEKSENINELEVVKELENIKTEIIILGASYLEMYKRGENVPIENITNTSLEKILAKNLTEEEKNELVNVYKRGRPEETYENKEHLESLVKEFKETLEKENTFIFNIRFNGEIIAFADFYQEDQDSLHIGGLTFLDDVRNPAIAQAVMNSIMNEFGDYNIKAEVHSKNKVLNMYRNRFDFKIVAEENFGGELYYKIVRSKKNEEIKEAA